MVDIRNSYLSSLNLIYDLTIYARFTRCDICISRSDIRRYCHSFNWSLGAEKFKIRENYIVPFLQWCTEFYGDLYEI